ncbi:hypothetical protein MKX47_21245 [Solibacillus sp. FSL R7-0668]|uniref:hypothetical protein n=1 Tax=Solibacillus sp. FSL R7-0668 TaxID=2921688 RepID=UPI0030F7D26F
MKITEAYTVYNNGIQSVEPKLAEAIDCIIDAKSKAVDRYKESYEICERGMHRAHDLYKDSQEKLDKVELAEVKARFELEQMNNTSIFRALAEIDRLQTALEKIAYIPAFKSQAEIEAFAEQVIISSRKALEDDQDAN